MSGPQLGPRPRRACPCPSWYMASICAGNKDMSLSAVSLSLKGREQAELTGLRLASLGLKFNRIVHSSMTRAVETTDIIRKHLPGECRHAAAQLRWESGSGGHADSCFPTGVNTVSTDLLREGAPIEPDPPVSHWKPEAVVKRPPTPTPLAAASPWGGQGSARHSAPSSITRMEPGSRLPSGTTSTGPTPSSRRTATRSSCATPTSSATSCAGEG